MKFSPSDSRPENRSFADFIQEDEDVPSWIFVAPFLSAYLVTMGADFTPQLLVAIGIPEAIAPFPVYMVFFSALFVYARRAVNGLNPVFQAIWDEMTVENSQNLQPYPNLKTIQRKIFHLFPPTKYEGINPFRLFSISFCWLSLGVALQMGIILLLGNILGTPVFNEIVGQYEDSRSFLPGFFAFINPVVAGFVLILQNLAGGPESAIIILSVIGLPAIVLAPTMRNFIAGIEYLFGSLVSRITVILPESHGDEKTRMEFVTISLTISIVFSHILFFY